MEILRELQLKGLRITSVQALRNKLAKFPFEKSQEEQLEALIHKGYGNSNAKKIGTKLLPDINTSEAMQLDTHETLFAHYYMNVREHKKSIYQNHYLPKITQLGLKPLSYKTFINYTNRLYNRLRMEKIRYGEDYFRKKIQTYIPQEKLQYSGSLWAADGSGTKLAYKDETGVHTLYMNRVFDVSSGCLLGYSIADTHKGAETERLIMQAFQRAMSFSGNRGAFELVSDNGGVYAKKQVNERLKHLFARVRRIQPGNSQANDAEHLIKQMNELARKYPNWAGQFSAKTQEYKANPELLSQNLISKAEAYQQIEELVRDYNNEIGIDGLSRIERYYRHQHPDLQPKDAHTLRRVFGNETQVDLSYMRGFVRVCKNGQQYLFVLENYEELAKRLDQLTGASYKVRVQVYWDEQQADLYNLQDVFICSCERAKLAHKTVISANDSSHKALQEWRKRKEQSELAVSEFVKEVEKGMEVIHELAEQKKAQPKQSQATESEALDYLVRAKIQKVAKEDANNQEEKILNQHIIAPKAQPRPVKSATERAFEQL